MGQKMNTDKYLYRRKMKYRGMEIHKKYNNREKERNANSGNIA
jgi:hypothetical protein